MSETAPHFRVKKWDDFQHYSGRTPPWIKLYNTLLEDYEFANLPDASKAHLMSIWLLASRMKNKIPADPDFIAKKINATDPVDLCTLLSTDFLELCGDASTLLAPCKHVASPEERRGETEVDEKQHTVDKPTDAFPVSPRKGTDGNYQYPAPFERAWAVYPSRDGPNPKVGAYRAFRARVKAGDDPERLVVAAEHYRKHVQSAQKEGTPFVLQAATFWGPKEPWRDYEAGAPTTNGSSTFVSDEAERWRKLAGSQA